MKDKSITRINNNKKSQKQQKNDCNKSKNLNIIINRVTTNFSNEKNNPSNNGFDNKNILKDSLNQLSNENLNHNKKNKNFEHIYENIQRYSNLNKVKRRAFNSRDKILKESSLLNKVKSKNEFISNNIKEKQKIFFNYKDEDNKKNQENGNDVKNIIYKKNHNIKNNLNNLNVKNVKKRNRVDEFQNYIKIEELNEIYSDTEEMDNKTPKDKRIDFRDFNSDVTSNLDEKEIISNTLTIKDELVNYESDFDNNNNTNKDNNSLKNSVIFNNELTLILDKHLTQIDFNKNFKNEENKKLASHSPPPKPSVQDKKTQMMSLNLNTINQIKENPFQKNNLLEQKEMPVNSAKMSKINKNIIRKSHHITKEKKELLLINYLKQNFFSKNGEKNYSNKNGIHKSKNDINKYEIKLDKNKDHKFNINNIRKKSNGINNEALKINIDLDEEEKKNKIKYKEYKIKNNSIVNGVLLLENDMEKNNNNKKNLNFVKSSDKLNLFSDLNNSLKNKRYIKDNNILKENNCINFIKNGNMQSNIDFINKKSDINNINGISLENEKNSEKKKKKNFYRNNSQNNDTKKKDSLSSLYSNKKDNESIKNIYQIKINNLNLNNLNHNTNITKLNKEKKDSNIKIENIEINNKFRKNIPSPQHRNKEKSNLIKKNKVSPININNSKLNSSNNLFNNANNNLYNNTNNNENINNNIQISIINDKERIKSNSNNFIESIANKNNNSSLIYKEKSNNELINKDFKNMNKLPSKKNINGINKNINPQKYKCSYKVKPKKSIINENSLSNNTNYCNPSTSTSNINNSEINLEENYINNKSPKQSKNNININNSANKFIILNKNKRNLHNINYNNNEEIINTASILNYINSNSYSTADKNSFIHITNSNVAKMKNKMNNNTNSQKGITQNYVIHPKNLFSSSNNNIKSKFNINKNNKNKKSDSAGNNSINKLNNSNSNIYKDINNNNNNPNILSKNINSDKKLNIYLYNNIKNNEDNNKKLENNINVDINLNVNKSPEIIKKSSTTMKNFNNQNNNNNNNNINPNINNRNSINGNILSSPSKNNSYNTKKIENKKICNKISNKTFKKNNIQKTINNKSNHYYNFNEDAFIDGQIPTVADENPNVNSLKIMKYNKCAYTNQIISQKLTKIFNLRETNDSILSFLSGNDLFNLSLVNSFYSQKTASKIYDIIIKKILNNIENTVKKIWNELLNKSMIYQTNNSIDEIYFNYLNSTNIYDEEITKDLLRTLPNNVMFKKDSSNYKKLFNVLKAYSNFNKNIGYAQGMNFIVAKLIIFNNSEKDSFLNLDALFRRLNFSDVIGISNGLEQKMFIIQFLLKKYCPYIIEYLEKKNINHEIFTVSWVITLFSKNFENNKLLLKIWNFSIIFGWKFIYLFTISVIDTFKDKYLKLELYDFTQFMKKIFKCSDFEKKFDSIIRKTFKYMSEWRKINKELEKNIENNKIKADTESGTEIIMDSFDEDTIIQ